MNETAIAPDQTRVKKKWNGPHKARWPFVFLERGITGDAALRICDECGWKDQGKAVGIRRAEWPNSMYLVLHAGFIPQFGWGQDGGGSSCGDFGDIAIVGLRQLLANDWEVIALKPTEEYELVFDPCV